MYLYRAMGIEEFKKFINNETIEGRGTKEHKWVCFMPETVDTLPISWVKNGDINTVTKPPIQVNARDTINSFNITRMNFQLYIKFYMDDAKFQETIESEKARMRWMVYNDEGLTGEYSPEHQALIKEYQISDYSSQDMQVSEIGFMNYDGKVCKTDLPVQDICKIADAQVTAPLIHYDKENHIAVFASRLMPRNKEYLHNFPDDTLIVCNTHFGTIVGIKPYFDSQYELNRDAKLELQRIARYQFSTLTDECGFIDDLTVLFPEEALDIFHRAVEKIYKYKDAEMPKELEEYFTIAQQAKTGISSEYLSNLIALKIDKNIYIPIGKNLFKYGDKFISGSQLIERLVDEPEKIAIQIGDYYTLYKEDRSELQHNAKISSTTELVKTIDINIDGEPIDLNEINKETIEKAVKPAENIL